MSTPLDFLTLQPAVGLVALQFLLYAAGWALGAWLLREQRTVLAHWAAFMAVTGLGFLLMTSRGEPRTWLAFNGSALCWSLGLVLLWRGVARHFRAEPWTSAQLALVVALLVGNVLLGPSLQNASLRVLFSYGSGMLIFALLIANTVPATSRRYGALRATGLVVPALIVMLAFSALLLRQLAYPAQPLELHRFEPRNVGALYAFVLAAALFNITFMALVVARLLRRLRELSVRDALTGLYNRREMDERLRQEWGRWRRGGAGFAIALLDLDNFKRVNDTCGHQAGDEVLRTAALWLASQVRTGDTPARVGGEEFLVLMPATHGRDAVLLAERLRQSLAGLRMGESLGAPPVTVSIGVAAVDPHDASPDALLRRADAALYRAKAGGRDSVELG